MRATLRKMGTKEVVGIAELKDGHVDVQAPFAVAAPLLVFFGATHVVPYRTERDLPAERAVAPGSDEHFALRLEALPVIGYYADNVTL